MDDKLFKSLKSIEAPEANAAARVRAREAAMAAFDAAQAAPEKNTAHIAQGNEEGGRLKSIASVWKRIWTMDIRVPLGATFAALLVVPVGWHFLNSSALVSPDFGPGGIESASVPVEDEEGRAEIFDQSAVAPSQQPMIVAQPNELAPPPAASPASETMATRQLQQSAAESYVYDGPAQIAMQPMGGAALPAGSGDTFTGFQEGGVKIVTQEPVSTFSVDVDTASYAYVRRTLEMGQTPPRDAVRVEELINYFSYDYAAPTDGQPFAPTVVVHPSPWNENNRLIHIGISGEDLSLEAAPPANLVFLIDTSGSMDSPDRLPLLKRAFGLLVNELGPDDTVSIVTYAGSAGVALEPTPGNEKAKILAALESLRPSGSTAGAQGIEMAYRLAEEALIAGGTNRVLLATDGDFNVGLSDPQALEDFIAGKRDDGIFLSVLGFGMGNYNDAIMQALAQAGNGNAAYIDSYSEARKVLVEEMGATLLTIAKDVKIQVEFNPGTVSEYRLIGYETRALNREDFNNDAVDAGDVGAGHTVTAIYEITPVGARGSVDPLRYGSEAEAASIPDGAEYGFLKIRYKAPDSDVSQLIEVAIPVADTYQSLEASPNDIKFATAVAAFGQKLRGSTYLRSMDWADIRALAQAGRGADETGRRAEFIRLVDMASSL